MAMVRLKYLNVFRRRGRVVAYYRRDTVRQVLLDETGKPVDGANQAAVARAWERAHAAYEEAQKAAEAAADRRMVMPQSMADLIARYRASVEFQRHKPTTRQDYEKALVPLERNEGKLPAAGMRPHHVVQIRDRYATRQMPDPSNPDQLIQVDNTRQANRIVTVLSILMTYARSTLGWRSDNPALRPKRLKSNSEGFKAWTRDQFETFMACPEVAEPLKRAAALGWYTGQRKADCLAMLRTARRDGWLDIFPEKTAASSRAKRMVPEHPELARRLDLAPASDAATLLTRSDGKAWKTDHFNHQFAAAVKAAGLDGLSFHGLRKGVMVELAERGATDAELDAVVPHTDPKVRTHYRAAANQKLLAQRAVARMGTSRARRERQSGKARQHASNP